MKSLVSLLLLLILFSCSSEKIEADLMVLDANIYTVNPSFDKAAAFAVANGKILAVGTSQAIKDKYSSSNIYHAQGKTIVPGLIDAHAHLYNLGATMQQVDLVGTTSKQEALERVVKFQNKKKASFILGRGWDQNDWAVKEFPSKHSLDSLFPDIPVALTRIDGHAYWANSKALELAGITRDTKVQGGEIVIENNEPSGIVIDSPMQLIRATIPEATLAYNTNALIDAQKKCFELGLTTINDAGLNREIIELIDKLQKSEQLKIRVYAMVSNTPKNLDYFLGRGIIKTDRLNVRSIKVYADGALGSRGAALKSSYSDKEGHFGAMITPQNELALLARRIANAGFQMNTHAIGDSANVAVLRAYKNALKTVTDARWKVEHAQILDLPEIAHFSKNIIPSVQPTHATSDMYWAQDRVGEQRIKGAYAYKSLLNQAGMIALGTDFPVERVNPMHTFYAAVARKDLENYPDNGFRKEEGLSREETLKGMTIWAAYSNFEENEKGSIEEGKFADFTVLDKDIMTCEEDDIPKITVTATFVNGEQVF